jgi:hypothetical protein
MTGYFTNAASPRRAMSTYLREYVEDATVMFCPSAPRTYKYLQKFWDAGEAWDNPDTSPGLGPARPDNAYGTYCFYWNYTGFIEQGNPAFRGPWGPSSRAKYSKLLVSDYFGYDHWRSPKSFGSCEMLREANITEGSDVSSAYWSRRKSESFTLDTIATRPHAGYTDGHVASFSPLETVPMRISIAQDGSRAFDDVVGKGVFFLPQAAVR